MSVKYIESIQSYSAEHVRDSLIPIEEQIVGELSKLTAGAKAQGKLKVLRVRLVWKVETESDPHEEDEQIEDFRRLVGE